jgi:hypothetical protein
MQNPGSSSGGLGPGVTQVIPEKRRREKKTRRKQNLAWIIISPAHKRLDRAPQKSIGKKNFEYKEWRQSEAIHF